ncbi:hypothetical protein S245_010467, partial [Arachis hypogaea]
NRIQIAERVGNQPAKSDQDPSSAKCPSLHQRKQTLASTNIVAVCRSERLLLPHPSHSRTFVFVLSAFVTSPPPSSVRSHQSSVRSPFPVRSHQSPFRRRPLRSTALRRRQCSLLVPVHRVFLLSVQKPNPLHACSPMIDLGSHTLEIVVRFLSEGEGEGESNGSSMMHSCRSFDDTPTSKDSNHMFKIRDNLLCTLNICCDCLNDNEVMVITKERLDELGSFAEKDFARNNAWLLSSDLHGELQAQKAITA